MEGFIEELHFLISVLVAVILGYERRLRFKEVGIRTHTIVCAGSALIMVVSKYGFGDSIEADASRVAVQIVSGIVFLGAGVIMYRRDAVYGIQLRSDMDDCWNRHDGWSGTLYIGYWYNFLVVFFQCVLHSKNPYFQTKQSYAYCIKFNKITTEEQDIDKLPQNTSLRKKYIDYVKSGKKSGWGYGAFVYSDANAEA